MQSNIPISPKCLLLQYSSLHQVECTFSLISTRTRKRLRKIWVLVCVFVFISIYIFLCLTYKMKDEINSQIVFPQRLKKYSLMLYSVTSFSNSKRVRQNFWGFCPPDPQLSPLCHVLRD